MASNITNTGSMAFQNVHASSTSQREEKIEGVKQAVASGVEALKEATADVNATGKIILIVDVDEVYSSILQSILEEVGCNVVCEFCGETGLHRMAMLQPDYVLIDYDLSDMTGLDFLKKANGSNLLKHIPIFLLTARNECSILKKSISYGARGYIAKPTNRETILLKLQEKSPGSLSTNG